MMILTKNVEITLSAKHVTVIVEQFSKNIHPHTAEIMGASLFHKIPTEIVDTIYELVADGNVVPRKQADPKRVLPATVYDSLASFDFYLREENAPCSHLSFEIFRRFRRRSYFGGTTPPVLVNLYSVLQEHQGRNKYLHDIHALTCISSLHNVHNFSKCRRLTFPETSPSTMLR